MPHSIPLFYRLFFLYFDPLICLSGIYLSFFDQHTFIQNGVPSALSGSITSSAEILPLAAYFMRSVGSYSVSIFALQILLLHQFKDAPNGLNVKIWRTLQFAILLIDLGLMYSVFEASPIEFLDVGGWSSGDWTNNGILGVVIVLRTAFLLGIGGVEKV
ncbi:hypothetical protein G7Y89_g8864 [Cudoniella acicularis]|uniref:DUF7704 domain-containing protein n=1 Tax=Cudoniella acicularis TaxID=354080 RepID=A0A8H4RJI5_9HELO|nr:hypothetical protein G7Y89_g8864 [Cudoniella acicularis]